MKIARSSAAPYSAATLPSSGVSTFEQSLIEDGSLVCWLDFRRRFWNAGRTVLTDKIGNAFTLTAGAAVQANDAQIGYADIAYFDAARRLVGPSILPTSGPLSFVFVGRISGSGLTGGRVMWSTVETSAPGPYLRYSAGCPGLGSVTSPDTATSGAIVIGCLSAVGSAAIRVNGAEKATGTISTTRTASLQFGGLISTNNTQAFFGNAAEAMVLAEDLRDTPTKLAALESYLSDKYNIPL